MTSQSDVLEINEITRTIFNNPGVSSQRETGRMIIGKALSVSSGRNPEKNCPANWRGFFLQGKQLYPTA